MKEDTPIKDLKKNHEYLSKNIPMGKYKYRHGIYTFKVIRITQTAILIEEDTGTNTWLLKEWGDIDIIEDITNTWNWEDKDKEE